MRILLFSGKGGVGKTSIAAATGLQLSRLGYDLSSGRGDTLKNYLEQPGGIRAGVFRSSLKRLPFHR